MEIGWDAIPEQHIDFLWRLVAVVNLMNDDPKGAHLPLWRTGAVGTHNPHLILYFSFVFPQRLFRCLCSVLYPHEAVSTLAANKHLNEICFLSNMNVCLLKDQILCSPLLNLSAGCNRRRAGFEIGTCGTLSSELSAGTVSLRPIAPLLVFFLCSGKNKQTSEAQQIDSLRYNWITSLKCSLSLSPLFIFSLLFPASQREGSFPPSTARGGWKIFLKGCAGTNSQGSSAWLLDPEGQFHFSPSKCIWKEINCKLMEKGAGSVRGHGYRHRHG